MDLFYCTMVCSIPDLMGVFLSAGSVKSSKQPTFLIRLGTSDVVVDFDHDRSIAIDTSSVCNQASFS